MRPWDVNPQVGAGPFGAGLVGAGLVGMGLVGMGLVGTVAGGNQVLAGAVVRCRSQAVAAGPGPGRPLFTGAPLLYRGGHPASQDDKCRDH
jgi:hypothetical protein